MNSVFNSDKYKMFIQEQLEKKGSHTWRSTGQRGLLEKTNIIEMINHANTHIYIVAKSSSRNFDADVVSALREATTRGIEVHVALYHPTPELPRVWKDIKAISSTFDSSVPIEKVKEQREVLITDDTLRVETLKCHRKFIPHDSSAHFEFYRPENSSRIETIEWIGFTETHSNNIDSIITQYFCPEQKEPNNFAKTRPITGKIKLFTSFKPSHQKTQSPTSSKGKKHEWKLSLPLLGLFALHTCAFGLKSDMQTPVRVIKSTTPIQKDLSHQNY